MADYPEGYDDAVETAVAAQAEPERTTVNEGRCQAPAVDAAVPEVNTLKAKALYTALSDAILFTAAKASGLPMLEAIRLEFGGGQLIAVATERFFVGASRVEYSGAAFDMLLEAADAKTLIKMAKTAKRDEGWREVTVEVADTDTRPEVTFRFNSGESVTVRGSDLDFTKWRHLIPADNSLMGGIVGMGYDPARLAQFAKVRPDEPGRQIALFPSVTDRGTPGPCAIRVGVNFMGALMPLRPAEGGEEWTYRRADWVSAPASVAASGPEAGR